MCKIPFVVLYHPSYQEKNLLLQIKSLRHLLVASTKHKDSYPTVTHIRQSAHLLLMFLCSCFKLIRNNIKHSTLLKVSDCFT